MGDTLALWNAFFDLVNDKKDIKKEHLRFLDLSADGLLRLQGFLTARHYRAEGGILRYAGPA